MKLGQQNIKMQELSGGFAPWTPYQGVALPLSHEIRSPKRQNAGAPGGLQSMQGIWAEVIFIVQHLQGHEISDPNGYLVVSYKMQGALVTKDLFQ
jgi:hypothetical protein